MEEEMIIEKIGVQHDRIRFRWTVPESLRSKLTIIRVAASIVQGGTSIPLRSIAIRPNETSYYFDKLLGNTTYRISVEGFSESESLLYASSLITTSLADLDWLPAPTDVTLADKSSDSLEITWTTPVVSSESKQSMVNQHVVTVYKFSLIDRIGIEKQRIIIRFPYTRVLLEDLEPRSVYNVTIQAGSDFGYGDMAWAVYSTLDIGEAFILRLFSRTPNSLTLKWQKSWLNGPDYSYTIRASTIHSLDGSVKEIAMSGSLGARQDPYHKLMNLTPGSAYNVTLSTIEERRKRYGVRRVKTIWAVFSTLKQGEYVVTSPRLAATTDLSASIVWQKIDHEKPVDYQIQYTLLTGNGMSTILDPLPENHCKCPKMSCDWLCALVFNLHRRPQDHAFQIRAKVDGIWNKWVPVVERPWSIMERACSINPPPFFVDHLNDTDYMRLIEFGNVDAFDTKTWRYVVVVDQRGGVDSSLSAIDISQLSDKATAEHNEVPYYITAAITPEEIKQWTSFRIGDGKLYGGYLNYPLSGMTDPKWYLIPLSRTENEIMEPHLKSCGLNEDGRFVCELTVLQVLSHIPRWLIFSILLLIILPVTVLIIYTTHCIRQRQSHKGSDSTRKKAQPAPKITSNRSKVVSHGFRMQTQQIPFCSRMSSGSPSAQRQSHVHKQCIGCDECRSLLDSVVGLCGQQSTAHIDSASLFERSDRPESNKLTRQSYRTKCDLCSVCHPNCS